MKISIIGRGQVGLALAPALANAGHEVRFGVRDPSDARHAHSETPVYSTRDASTWGEVIITAIRWDGVDSFLADAGDLAGKVLIDCINPLDFTGGLGRLIPANISTASLIQERTQAAAHRSRLMHATMRSSHYSSSQATMARPSRPPSRLSRALALMRATPAASTMPPILRQWRGSGSSRPLCAVWRPTRAGL